jgi:hypothetical protein
MLGDHCPKLLRIHGCEYYFTLSEEPSIWVQRMNGEQKFRRVRQVRKFINDDDEWLYFDYDSVEDCSDDDSLERPERVRRM